jgi:peptidoglycan biosynthesis protein MviN/MurJ (putative lipid II flippase)
MAKAGSANQSLKMSETFTSSLSLVIFLTLPITLGLFFLREPVIVFLFGRGAFDAKSAAMTAGVLEGYSLAIVGQSLLLVLLRTFLSLKELMKPMASYLGAAALTILADFLLYSVKGTVAHNVAKTAAIGARNSARSNRPAQRCVIDHVPSARYLLSHAIWVATRHGAEGAPSRKPSYS